MLFMFIQFFKIKRVEWYVSHNNYLLVLPKKTPFLKSDLGDWMVRKEI